MIFKVKMLKIVVILVGWLTLSVDLKSQNAPVSDSIVEFNPIDIFKNWKNLDTIRVKYESSGCRYYAETIELIKTEDIYLATIFNKQDSVITQKKLNLEKLDVLKNALVKVLIKPREEACLQDYYLTFSINSILYSKTVKEYDCRMNSFWEIKETVFDFKN